VVLIDGSGFSIETLDIFILFLSDNILDFLKYIFLPLELKLLVMWDRIG
jgi:hypothetical protein